MINQIFVSDIDKARSLYYLRNNNINHVISLIDPDAISHMYEFMTYNAKANWDYFVFYDVEYEPYDGPKPEKEDVERMVEIYKEMMASERSINLLVHCHAGISRSAATALVLLYMLEKDETKAFNRLIDIRPICYPNLRILNFADEILGSKLAELITIWRNAPEWERKGGRI